MTDEAPENIDLNWIGHTLVAMRRELRDNIAELKRMRAEDRSLLEDVAREAGIEPTPARLTREQFETKTDERLKRLEDKVFPPAE